MVIYRAGIRNVLARALFFEFGPELVLSLLIGIFQPGKGPLQIQVFPLPNFVVNLGEDFFPLGLDVLAIGGRIFSNHRFEKHGPVFRKLIEKDR